MKKNTTILLLFSFIAVSLSAQTIPAKPFQSARFVHQPVKSRSLIRQVQDSLPFTICLQQQRIQPIPAYKSGPVYRQKMDSLKYQQYDDQLEVLNTLENSTFGYDYKGRVILGITYTRNTWDDLYHWYKDTFSFDDRDNTTLEILYTRELETDPWTLIGKTESFYDANGKDTLSIYYSKDWEIGEYVTEKIVSSYDPGNLWIHTTMYRLDTVSSSWVNSGKMEITFDSGGNLLTYSYYSWSVETLDWIQLVQEEYTYDSNGNVTLFLLFQWNTETRSWVGRIREEFSYDGRGNPIEMIRFRWHPDMRQWILWWKETNECDLSGNATETILYLWNSNENQWLPQYRESNSFDANSHQTLYIDYYWNQETGQWDPVEKYTWAYNVSGKQTEYISYEWITENMGWWPTGRDSIIYNSDNKILLYDYFDWDFATGTWTESSRQENDFDSYGNLLLTRSLGSKDSTGQWTSRYKTEYTYDRSWLDAETISPYGWSGELPYHQLLGGVVNRWNNTTGEWYTTMTQDYYYSEFNGSSGIPESNLTAIQVFPNPATDMLFIETGTSSGLARFEIHDMQGRKVLSRILTGNHNQVMVGDLPGGVYVYQILIKGELHNGKIVIN